MEIRLDTPKDMSVDAFSNDWPVTDIGDRQLNELTTEQHSLIAGYVAGYYKASEEQKSYDYNEFKVAFKNFLQDNNFIAFPKKDTDHRLDVKYVTAA